MSDYPIVRLNPEADRWAASYERANALDKQFPDQAAEDLVYACLYNGHPFGEQGITSLVCEQEGENDGQDWIWVVQVEDGTRYRLTGGCDYTGWDCQSFLEWKTLP